MEKTYNKRRFELIINGTHTFLRWAVKGIYVLLGLLVIGALVVLFIPKSSLDFDLANLQNININVMNIYYQIDESLFTGVINVKWTLVLLGLTLILSLGFVQYLMILIRNIVRDVKEDTPFTQDNVKRVKFMSYGYLVASVILPLVSGAFFFRLFDQIGLNQVDVNLAPNFQFIFMGVIIFILAIIFERGAYLQEDHDMTV